MPKWRELMTTPDLLNPLLPVLWHGGDYNPEQWPPNVWDEDVQLMKAADFRVATLGVFSWAKLEPREGEFDFSWLDEVIERLTIADRYFILATPSAAPPAWMSAKYPDVLRTGPDRIRRLHGNRVNYNPSSPVYREKTRLVARLLAERYGAHPRLLAWHISNEYGGADYGQESLRGFRAWLQLKYGSLESLNAAYWTSFWSHDYQDWDQIDAPGQPHGETSIPGLTVDWQRFVTDSTVEFMLNESRVIREISPTVPITTNFMGTYPGLDYHRFAPHLDFTCWDSYPAFGGPLTETQTWIRVAFKHDLTRCLSGNRKWMLMECSPGSSNWYPSMALKKPGLHRFEVLQAIAHGADGAQYFQWRQSRGSQEQLHGAVVGHGTGATGRVFQEVCQVGKELDALGAVVGSRVKASVAVVYDWNARWALDAACGPVQRDKGYEETCIAHYGAFWSRGIPTDVIGQADPLGAYRLVVAPMAYSLQPGFAERVSEFVRAGGTFVTTYLTGWTDENSLVYADGLLGPLRETMGIWTEEMDALDVGEGNRVHIKALGIDSTYEAKEFCELIHTTTAKTLGTYQTDFYSGNPAVTVNEHGAGRAYYVASRNDREFTDTFLRAVADEAGIKPIVEDLPEGVTAQSRVAMSQDSAERFEWVFLMNAGKDGKVVRSREFGEVRLPAWGVEVRRRGLRE